MSADYATELRTYLAAVDRIASERIPGAILRLEADDHQFAALTARTSHGHARALLQTADDLACAAVAHAGYAARSWNRFELAARGARQVLVARGADLLLQLLAHPECCCVPWRVIFIAIFPGDPLRTHCCDPAYGLAAIPAPAVVWVDPYPHDDWKESQRYPTVTEVWRPKLERGLA